MSDEADDDGYARDQCSNCQTKNPVGGLHKTDRRIDRPPAFTETVYLCDFCYGTQAGSRFMAGGVAEKELVTLAQCMNILRQDMRQLMQRMIGV